jgi:hypothetical protein
MVVWVIWVATALITLWIIAYVVAFYLGEVGH